MTVFSRLGIDVPGSTPQALMFFQQESHNLSAPTLGHVEAVIRHL